jgi:hypothetical protein
VPISNNKPKKQAKVKNIFWMLFYNYAFLCSYLTGSYSNYFYSSGVNYFKPITLLINKGIKPAPVTVILCKIPLTKPLF